MEGSQVAVAGPDNEKGNSNNSTNNNGRKKKIFIVLGSILLVGAVAVGVVFGAGLVGGLSRTIPKVKPLVEAAAPKGLGGGTGTLRRRFLQSAPSGSAAELESRFFAKVNPGPTNVWNLLENIDKRIASYLKMPCKWPTATEYELKIFNSAGTKKTFYHQCSFKNNDWVNGGKSYKNFILLGFKETKAYFYERSGETNVAAIVDTAADNSTTVELFYTVGLVNQGGSRGIVHLYAKPSQKTFELSIGGNGFGYCGAQMKSNGLIMNFTGSSDMGATCVDTFSICIDADTLTSTTGCNTTTSGVSDFTLPAYGRLPWASFVGEHSPNGIAGSKYPGPGLNQVELDPASTEQDVDWGPADAI